jgi:hypothetical protein
MTGDITWLDVGSERNVPHRLVNPELVSYPLEKTVIVNGKKVIERSRVEFTIVTVEWVLRK